MGPLILHHSVHGSACKHVSNRKNTRLRIMLLEEKSHVFEANIMAASMLPRILRPTNNIYRKVTDRNLAAHALWVELNQFSKTCQAVPTRGSILTLPNPENEMEDLQIVHLLNDEEHVDKGLSRVIFPLYERKIWVLHVHDTMYRWIHRKGIFEVPSSY